MEPKRFRELQKAAETGAVTLKKEELRELLDNTISLMGEYAHKAKEAEKRKKELDIEKAFVDAETRAMDEAKKQPFRFRRQVGHPGDCDSSSGESAWEWEPRR